MAKQAILLNDFFKNFSKKRKLKVFLCGARPKDEFFDLRFRVKRILRDKMGCSAFLGEEIEDIRKSTKVHRDQLTIEVGEARQSDLVLMFLGSPGTIAEVTAFAMDQDITRKLFVFNDIRYKDAESFINFGPLRLLGDEQVIYYEPNSREPSDELVERIDVAVARIWYNKSKLEDSFDFEMAFETFVTIACIYAAFPVRYAELLDLLPLNERTVRGALNNLFTQNLIETAENKYLPTEPLQALPLGRATYDVARSRARLMAGRLSDADHVSDYRIIL